MDSAASLLSSWTGQSNDGLISYTLSVDGLGVLLERRLFGPGLGQIVQYVLFRDAETFKGWASEDSARFTYPLLFSELCRHFDEQLSYFLGCEA